MNERASYLIEFQLADSEDTSPADFRSLFSAVDDLTRLLLVDQLRVFVETGADLPGRARDEILFQAIYLSRFIAPPAQVRTIKRQSPWTVVIALSVPTVIWSMRKLIAPQVLKAWDDSKLQEAFRRFVRDYIFMGAKDTLEAGASNQPRHGNLVIDDITETGGSSEEGEPEVRITLKRTEVISVDLKDRDLRNEFLKKLGIKPE